jgi:antitoxin HigA-1
MTIYRTTGPDPRRSPIHPGAILREDTVPALGMSVTEVAAKLGVSRQALHHVSAEMAARIGKLCGNGPGLWLAMQEAHDLAEELARIPTIRAA